MGFGEKFKDLAKQAQDAVAEHKGQIHDAVDAVGVAADRKTKGKYSDKIAKAGQKAGAAVDKLGGDDEQPAPAAAAPTPTAPAADAPAFAPGQDPAADSGH